MVINGLLRPNIRLRKKRQGRGFSFGELREASLNVQDAHKLGLAVDRRRKSIHEENVKVLKYIKEQTGG